MLKWNRQFRAEISAPLIQQKLLQLTIPNKPKSPAQKYKTAEKSKEMLVLEHQ